MPTRFDRIRRRRLMGEFASLADLDRSSAATVLGFLADEAGTAVVEAAVVATRVMALVDEGDAGPWRVLDELTSEVDSGELRFPVSGRALRDSCHLAQARRLALATLENLRPAAYAELCDHPSAHGAVSSRRHLTAVPPPPR